MSQNLLAQIALAGQADDYADKFPEGEHIAALNVCEWQDTEDYGRIISTEFLILESTDPKCVGKPAGVGFFVSKSDKEGGKSEKQRAFSMAAAAVKSLGGDPEDVTIDQGQTLSRGQILTHSTLSEMLHAQAPWRGLMLKVIAVKRTRKNKAGEVKTFVNVKFEPVTQNVQQIHACRARIESGAKAVAPAVVAPAAQPQSYAPAPQPVAPAAPVGMGMGGSLLNR